LIELNGNTYRLCLIDTNVVSEMLKRPQREFANFFTKYMTDGCIPCFSIWTLLELRESRDLLPTFLEYFSVIPCAILKSHEQLLHDEVAGYSQPSEVNPILVAFTPIQKPPMRALIDKLFSIRKTRDLAAGWLDGRAEMLEGMLSLRGNYRPENGKSYSKKEISFFIFSTVTSQLGMRQMSFCQQLLRRNEPIDIDSFPSVKATSYTVFFKFYVDNRNEKRSDVFDILISTSIPYVDVFLTERHQTEVIRRIRLYDRFLDHVNVQTITALR
jgi:hypothetical protein